MTDYPRIFFACHTRHVRDPATDEPLSTTLAGILDHLDDVEGIAVTDLAAHLGVTASTMSLSIDRLERRGYAKRFKDRTDGRRVLIRITPAGLRLREAKSVLDPALVRNLLRRLDPPRRTEALRGLSLLAEAAGAAVAVRATARTPDSRRGHARKNTPASYSDEARS